MSQLGRRHQVTDREDAGGARAHPLVDTHETPLVDLDARAVGQEAVGERAPPDRHHDRLHLELLPVAEEHSRVVALGLVTGDDHAGAHRDPALGEGPHDHAGHVRVAAGEDLRQGLQQRDLHAEIDEQRGELAADGARADHGRRLRELAERQHLVRGLDVAPVHLEAGKRPRHRA